MAAEPARSTLKRLFARSVNACAFPGCTLPLFEESGTLTGTVCHIKARNPGGPRFDPQQTDRERHGYDNLILLCARHSKVIDADPAAFGAELLARLKAEHERKTAVHSTTGLDSQAEALLGAYRATYNITAGGHVMINSAGAIQATHLTVKAPRRSVKLLPTAGSLGASLIHRNYVKHLIDRYNEFASKQPGRAFAYAAIYGLIKRQFKADWQHVPVSRFDELADYLQHRIDNTQLGRINRGKGIRNYSAFADFQAACGG